MSTVHRNSESLQEWEENGRRSKSYKSYSKSRGQVGLSRDVSREIAQFYLDKKILSRTERGACLFLYLP